MSQPTIEQMATVIEGYAHHTRAWPDDYETLQYAARTLRAMQGKEHSSAAATSSGGSLLARALAAGARNRERAREAADPPPPEDSRRKGTTPLIVGKTYDPATASRIPPPPEDALLGDIAAWIIYLDAHIKEWSDANDIGLRETLQRARERIAADAETLARVRLQLQIALDPDDEPSAGDFLCTR